MQTDLNIKFEEAVRLLVEHMSPSDENSRKPIMFHDIRVGVYLYEGGYSADVVLAGVLHDVIEWSDMGEDIISERFGNRVLELVLANTKDLKNEDKKERSTESIRNCVENGQDALIIKTADVIDSFKWYLSQDNERELSGHCMRTASDIFEYKPENFNDKVFDELRVWQEKCSNLDIK